MYIGNKLIRIILYYIISEIDKLLHFNKNNYTKINYINFMIEFITIIYNMFNQDKIMDNYNIKRFNYIIHSIGYIHDIEKKTKQSNETIGIYEEQKSDEMMSVETKEKIYDAEQADQSLDMDVGQEDILDYYPQIDDDYQKFVIIVG